MAEHVRRKRQDIQQFLSTFVQDVEGFRPLMRKTGGILVGEIATAFFTGTTRGEVNSLDLVLYNVNLESCTNSWFSFLKGKTMKVSSLWTERYVLVKDMSLYILR
jgi:hypothetical protein